MPSSIPTSFDRIKTTKIACRNGWVFARPMQGGERYYVTATAHRAETVDRRDVYYVVREYVEALGGLVPYMPGPLPRDYESGAQEIVAHLLEANTEDPDDPEGVIQREVDARSEPLKEVKVYGRRWFQRGPGNTYHSAYIYVNGKLVHTIEFAYGYGQQYLYNAMYWLEKNGYLDIERYQNGGHEAPWQTAERMGFTLLYDVMDVPRKRDL